MATKIKTLREERGISVIDFCREADLHPQDFYCIQKGTRKVGSRKAAQIAAALDVEPNFLFDEKGWALS